MLEPGPARLAAVMSTTAAARTPRAIQPDLEQPGGDRGGQGAVQVPAALGPVDALPGEAFGVTASYFGEHLCRTKPAPRSGPGYLRSEVLALSPRSVRTNDFDFPSAGQALAEQGVEQPDSF